MHGGKERRRPVISLLTVVPVLALLLLVLGGALWPPGPAVAGLAAWELTADLIEHHREPRRVEATGGVVLSRPPELGAPLTIRADWMSYNPLTGVMEARGRVEIDSPGERTLAETASMHLESQTGTLGQAAVHLIDDGFYLQGELIEKLSADRYYLENAWYSACVPKVMAADDEACEPAWSVKSSRAHITLDGMARLYHPRFQVKEKPLLYSPYLLLPAKTQRQTGFLFPEWSYADRQGFGLSLPFFINLSPSADITLYPSHLAKRGLLAGAEFRYAATPDSKGMLVVSALDDRLEETAQDNYRNDGQLRQTSNRYWVRGKADHDFGDNLMGRVDLDLVSDQDFIQEFDSGRQGYSRNNRDFEDMFDRELREASLATRHSSAQLTKITPTTLLAGEMAIQQDSRHRRPVGPTPLQALPRLNFSGRTPLPDSPLSLAWNSEYVHYWRSEGIGAHRLDLHPRLIAPMPRSQGWTEGRVTAGLRQTMYKVTEDGDYQWEHDTYQDRTALDIVSNLATTLVRDFSLADRTRSVRDNDRQGDPQEEREILLTERRLEHMVRPNLIYTYTTNTNQGELPNLDGVDRLARRNWLTYELNNYFDLSWLEPVAKKPINGEPINGEPMTGEATAGEPELEARRAGAAGWSADANEFRSRSLAEFKVLQTYDIAEVRRDLVGPADRRREFSDLRFELRAAPLPRINLRYQTNLSMYGQGINRYDLQGSYSLPRGARMAVNYRYLKHSGMTAPYFHTTSGERRHDILARFSSPLTNTLSMHALLNQSLADNHISEAALGLAYQPHCWRLDLQVRRHVDEKSIMVVFTLDTIGQVLDWAHSEF